MRRHALGRAILGALDIPVWVKPDGLIWKVKMRLIRHASTFALPGGAEPAIAALFVAILKCIGVRSFWDIGANVGYYSWLIKGFAPEARVRIFEPEPDNLVLIRDTMRRIGLHGITLREVAVTDVPGERRFRRDRVSGFTGSVEGSGDTFSQREWGLFATPIAVQAVSVDAERVRAGVPDLIKIDVEGHEEAVVRGAQSTLRSDQPIVVFECFHGGDEITKFLESLGYWVGDAERMDEDRRRASNFLALPPRHTHLLKSLRQAWTEQTTGTAESRVHRLLDSKGGLSRFTALPTGVDPNRLVPAEQR